jgi:hypothetical protein
MDSSLTIVITWTWGGSVVVRTDSTTPICDVLSCHGFCSIEGSHLLAVYKGTVIEPALSFHYYNIKTGDHLFCLLKLIVIPEKSPRYCESVTRVRFAAHASAFRPVSDASQRDEESRLADLSFSSWESMRELPQMMNDLFIEQEAEARDETPVAIIPATVVREGGSIRNEPLPNLFARPVFSVTGIVRAG